MKGTFIAARQCQASFRQAPAKPSSHKQPPKPTKSDKSKNNKYINEGVRGLEVNCGLAHKEWVAILTGPVMLALLLHCLNLAAETPIVHYKEAWQKYEDKMRLLREQRSLRCQGKKAKTQATNTHTLAPATSMSDACCTSTASDLLSQQETSGCDMEPLTSSSHSTVEVMKGKADDSTKALNDSATINTTAPEDASLSQGPSDNSTDASMDLWSASTSDSSESLDCMVLVTICSNHPTKDGLETSTPSESFTIMEATTFAASTCESCEVQGTTASTCSEEVAAAVSSKGMVQDLTSRLCWGVTMASSFVKSWVFAQK